MSEKGGREIIDVTDEASFARMPPCVDTRFDHRSCDYWEHEVRGSKSARPSWWRSSAQPAAPTQSSVRSDNPFAAAGKDKNDYNPFATSAIAAALDPPAGDEGLATPTFNPFAPTPDEAGKTHAGGPRKLRLLDRGRAVFGSYAKILLLDGEPAVYAQFGPLSAYPRARQIRDLYPRLRQSPLPAVITCVATAQIGRSQGLGRELVGAICEDLASRGFAAVEAYPDLTLRTDEASAAHPEFWLRCGFAVAADDERYPVMRRPLD